jgi:mycothiol system anti-sigma-R factor
MAECGPNCEETLRQIEAYLDGEVDALRAHEIQLHLSDCDPCMDRAEFRTHLKTLVHDRCAEAEPDGLREKILAAIDTRETPPDPSA